MLLNFFFPLLSFFTFVFSFFILYLLFLLLFPYPVLPSWYSFFFSSSFVSFLPLPTLFSPPPSFSTSFFHYLLKPAALSLQLPFSSPMSHFSPNSKTTRAEVIALDDKGGIKRRLDNTIMKDTINIPHGGYTVIRFTADNPGRFSS